MQSPAARANSTTGRPDRGTEGATFTTEPQNPRAARAASTAKPPLGKNDIAGLLARFDKDIMPPLHRERLDVDSLMRLWANKMDVHGLLSEFEDEPQTQQWVIDSRPDVDHGYYCVDPRTVGIAGVTGALHCVYTRPLYDRMLLDGYMPAGCTYHARDERLLPAPVPVSERMQYQQQETAAVPEPVTIPDSEPAFSKCRDAITAAQQLVQWMEEAVTVDTVKYSPMKLWAPEHRSSGFTGQNKHQQFYKRCLTYVYVRNLEVAPHLVTDGWGKLRLKPAEAIKSKELIVPEWVAALKEVGDGRVGTDSWAWAKRVAEQDQE